jgi:hypothetical protein
VIIFAFLISVANQLVVWIKAQHSAVGRQQVLGSGPIVGTADRELLVLVVLEGARTTVVVTSEIDGAEMVELDAEVSGMVADAVSSVSTVLVADSCSVEAGSAESVVPMLCTLVVLASGTSKSVLSARPLWVLISVVVSMSVTISVVTETLSGCMVVIVAIAVTVGRATLMVVGAVNVMVRPA